MKRLFLIFLLIPLYSWSDNCSTVDSCHYSSMWSEFSRFKVTYSGPKNDKGSTFEYYVSDNESLMSFDTKNGKARIYSIPGVATLWSGIDQFGIKTSQECYGVVKDTFAIIRSYAVRPLFFLGYGTKGGPEGVESVKNIDITSDEDTKVQINPGDHMVIGGPWLLKGKVEKEKGVINFNIHHEFVGKDGKEADLYLAGIWDENSVEVPVEESESLDDWLVCMTGKYSYENGKSIFTPYISDTSSLSKILDVRALTKPSSGHAKDARR